VWEVLESPPIRSYVIVHPGAYNDAPIKPRWPERALRKARAQLAPRSWTRAEHPVGDYAIRQRLVHAGTDAWLADSIAAAHAFRASLDEETGVDVQVLRFDAPSDARSYVENLQSRARVVASATRADPYVTGVVTAFDACDSDHSARETYVFDLFMGDPKKISTVWVARDEVVVQVVMMNHQAPDRRLGSAIERIFRALK
jgi:hypothetical protein